jgi:hypothetical protein
MAHDVFISHSSKDKPIADAICTNLEVAGIRCWIAPRDIAPGEDWPTAITKAIAQSRVMVLVFSANSNSSEDVSRELMLAASSKLVIVPFKIENVEPEPGKQYYLARTHWLDAMNPPTKEQIKSLVLRVGTILKSVDENTSTSLPDSSTLVPATPQPALRKKPVSVHYLWIPAVLFTLFTIGATIFGISRNWNLTTTVRVPTLTKTAVAATQTLLPDTTQPFRTVELIDDFNNQVFDGSFDSSRWTSQSDFSEVSIKQTNGVMVLTKPSISGMESGDLQTNQTWSFGEIRYIEARLKLDQEHTGDMGNAGFSLGDVGCSVQIQGESTTPFIWCAQSHFDPDQQWIADYMSGSYYIEYGKWYTTRIEFNSQTNEFTCYIDGKLFYFWQPANIDDLLRKKSSVSIGVWADNGTAIIGYVDDVKILK